MSDTDERVEVLDADPPLSVTNAVTTAAPSPIATIPPKTAIQSVRLFIAVACRKALLRRAEVDRDLRAGSHASVRARLLVDDDVAARRGVVGRQEPGP